MIYYGKCNCILYKVQNAPVLRNKSQSYQQRQCAMSQYQTGNGSLFEIFLTGSCCLSD